MTKPPRRTTKAPRKSARKPVQRKAHKGAVHKAHVADTGARAEWTVRDAKRLRVDGDKHHTQDALAKEAGVTGDTVSKIERRIPVSRRSAMKVFDALNKCHESGLKQSRLVVRVPVAKRRK